ncbi:hypothetical protein H696_03360 [Fonticula alba]|uniref:Uncharacterized protein n=1 Tax=Fonticula alba TaxID=691883 RepID=A0A058Z7J2_FONAL|nr:hypothetical protein H696_03360 [Fonticula alba]KCV69893.1 hypothetical protein H696_03360 [Fonticula alba]|eukprot:XP_009495499.1 hypothetical protein H696_03360 [Fonticula alba]
MCLTSDTPPRVPKDAGDRGSFVAFAHSVLDWCLIQMKTKASGEVVPPRPGPPEDRAPPEAPSPERLTAFSLELATLCSWLDLHSVLYGRRLALLSQYRRGFKAAFPHAEAGPRDDHGRLPPTSSVVANHLYDLLQRTRL